MTVKTLTDMSFSGVVESTVVGFKFPDGKTQSTAVIDSNKKENPTFKTDFLIPLGVDAPWGYYSNNNGGVGGPAASYFNGNCNGLLEFDSSSSGSNSGATIRTGYAQINLIGGESANFIFLLRTSVTTLVGRLGFSDADGTSEPADAVMLLISGNGTDATVTARCIKNSTTTSVVMGDINLEEFYHARITLNSSSSATFEIFDLVGALVFTETIITNIPSGRLVGHHCQFFNTAAESRKLAIMDWMDFTLAGRVRGAP